MSHAAEVDRPTLRVLCLSGHDPGGGAGIHADIEAVAAQGAHALTVITALTVQDSHDVRRVQSLPAALMREQVDCLLADGPVAALKVGLLGTVEQVEMIAGLTAGPVNMPMVLDPVLRAGGGTELAGQALQAALCRHLLPRVTVLTPNAAEARRLVPTAGNLDQAASGLLRFGCHAVLITGGDEPGSSVCNRLYRPDRPVRDWTWPRLPRTFHGAGCTLAAALAARLATGEDLETAADRAQAWTQDALRKARRVGSGRPIPGRSTHTT